MPLKTEQTQKRLLFFLFHRGFGDPNQCDCSKITESHDNGEDVFLFVVLLTIFLRQALPMNILQHDTGLSK